MKQLAIEAKDHEQELKFLADEYRAKRFHETNGLALIPNYLYDVLSNYGRSIQRPFWFLAALWLSAAQILTRDGCIYALFGARAFDALLVSAGNLLPFIGGSRAAIEHKRALFPEVAKGELFPTWVDALGIIEGLLAAVFIFLIGLALRNRFRL